MMMSKRLGRVLAMLVALALVAVACSSGGSKGAGGAGTTAPAKNINYKAVGLWDRTVIELWDRRRKVGEYTSGGLLLGRE